MLSAPYIDPHIAELIDLALITGFDQNSCILPGD